MTALIIILSQSVAKSNDTIDNNKELADEMIEVADLIVTALGERDFFSAREGTESLLPMIRKDLKEHKKLIVLLKKQDLSDEVKRMKAQYKRKSELHENLQHLLEVSPAALRVRYQELAMLVAEYREMMTR